MEAAWHHLSKSNHNIQDQPQLHLTNDMQNLGSLNVSERVCASKAFSDTLPKMDLV